VLLVPSDVVPPDVPAIQGETIVLVSLRPRGIPDLSVTGGALHASHCYVGWVREENTLRLAGIYEPRDLIARFDVFLDELGFFRMASKLLFMALNTRGQFGNAREAAVLPEIVAALATLINLLHMQGMVEIYGLIFLGI
jgi:hypothetical protein